MLKRTWQESGYAQVLVTHSVEEAVFLGQRVVVMTPRPGRVAYVLENTEMTSDDWRSNPLFFGRCRTLRDILRKNAVTCATSACGDSAFLDIDCDADVSSGPVLSCASESKEANHA